MSLEQAQHAAAQATKAEGVHPLYALRMARLPLSIAQAGIFDHLGDSEHKVRDKQQDVALHVLQIAREVGNDRHVEQMTDFLVRLRK
jgi:hypothetical protein